MNATTATATLAKSLATTIARGTTLLIKDGYTVAPVASRPAIYTVTRPADRPVRVGEKPSYTVDVAGGTCDCRAFAQHGTCKHLIGATEAVAQALALVGPLFAAPAVVNAATIEAQSNSKPASKVGRYGSEQWKASVARDFC